MHTKTIPIEWDIISELDHSLNWFSKKESLEGPYPHNAHEVMGWQSATNSLIQQTGTTSTLHCGMHQVAGLNWSTVWLETKLGASHNAKY